MKYTDSITRDQWKWLLDRYAEGYPLESLAAFVGLNARTVTRRWDALYLRSFSAADRIPLDARRDEFNFYGAHPLPTTGSLDPGFPLDETLALALMAGASVIDHSPFRPGTTYLYTPRDGSAVKSISYRDAAAQLRQLAEKKFP